MKILKSITLVALMLLFVQCEKDNSSSAGDTTNEVYLNGEKLILATIKMGARYDQYDGSLYIRTNLSDVSGTNKVEFTLLPPSIDSIAGTYILTYALDPYRLDLNSMYTKVSASREEFEYKFIRRGSKVTVTNNDNNNYLYEIILNFSDENFAHNDTITGFFNATLTML